MKDSQKLEFYKNCEGGNLPAVRQALESTSEGAMELLNWRNPNDRYGTVLHAAAYKGHAAVVELLLAEGANLSAPDNRQFTALHYATEYGHKAVAELLLKAGADATVQNIDGNTPAKYVHNAMEEIRNALAEATERKKKVENLREELAKNEEETLKRKEVIEDELAPFIPVLESAKKAKLFIKNEHLFAIKEFTSMPPEPVTDVLSAVFKLLGTNDCSWLSMKRFLGNRGVRDQLLNYDARHMTLELRKEVSKIMKKKAASFEEANIKRVCQAAAPLAAWVKVQIRYSMALDEIDPLKKEAELEEAKNTWAKSKQRLEQCDSELKQIDDKVATMKTMKSFIMLYNIWDNETAVEEWYSSDLKWERLGQERVMEFSLDGLKGVKTKGPGSFDVLEILRPKCGLQGSIPTEIGFLKHIIVLNLSGNQLYGDLMPLKGLEMLENLDLSNNQISGTLLPLKDLEHIKICNLSRNDLAGTIPADFLRQASPEFLDLSSNSSLNGTIPDHLIQNELTFMFSSTGLNFSDGIVLNSPKFGFYVIPTTTLLSLERLLKHEDAVKRGIPILLRFKESFCVWVKGDGTEIGRDQLVFISHRWLSSDHPDDDRNSKLHHLKSVLQEKSELEYVWIDFLCIPQVDAVRQQDAINSLPYYVRSSGTMITLCGNSGEATLDVYKSRGWCRMEQLSSRIQTFSDNSTLLRTRLLVANKDDATIDQMDDIKEDEINPLKGVFYDENDKVRLFPVIKRICDIMANSEGTDIDSFKRRLIGTKIQDSKEFAEHSQVSSAPVPQASEPSAELQDPPTPEECNTKPTTSQDPTSDVPEESQLSKTLHRMLIEENEAHRIRIEELEMELKKVSEKPGELFPRCSRDVKLRPISESRLQPSFSQVAELNARVKELEEALEQKHQELENALSEKDQEMESLRNEMMGLVKSNFLALQEQLQALQQQPAEQKQPEIESLPIDEYKNQSAPADPDLTAEIYKCNGEWTKTKEMMERLISRPKMKEKYLKKPHFCFLHDTFSEIAKATQFSAGLFSGAELDGQEMKRAAKIAYLEKMIKCVSFQLGITVDARPSKIVAGKEAEHTNRLLQLIALAAAKKPDSTLAVECVLNGTEMPAPSAAPAPAPAPAPACQRICSLQGC